MKSELYWVETAHPGRLAIMPRPRGGDWLADEVEGWHRARVDVVVSLLTSDEITHFDLASEGDLCRASGIVFIAFPILDREVPSSRDATFDLIANLAEHLVLGKNIAIHCRQGIGRAGLIAVSVLAYGGVSLEVAIQRVSAARGCPVPETTEQRRWIVNFADSLMTRRVSYFSNA